MGVIVFVLSFAANDFDGSMDNASMAAEADFAADINADRREIAESNALCSGSLPSMWASMRED